MNNKYKKMAFGVMYSIGLLYSAGRFIYWNLDNQYGDGYTIRECLEANSKAAFNALSNIYDEALFDIYVFLTYLIICFVLIIYIKKTISKGPEITGTGFEVNPKVWIKHYCSLGIGSGILLGSFHLI